MNLIERALFRSLDLIGRLIRKKNFLCPECGGIVEPPYEHECRRKRVSR